MPTVIAIGASAGGPSTLADLLGRLPADLRAAVLIAVHLPPHGPSHLAHILARATPLRVVDAAHDEAVQAGSVYVAVPDRHLMLAGDRLRLTRGPRENHSRPAIDVLFRSCALSLGSRAIGVVLTGTLDDGTAGLWTIKDVGGQTIVQAPDDAEFPSMPQSALEHVAVDHVASIVDMPMALIKTVEVSERRSRGAVVSEKLKTEAHIAEGRDALVSGSLELGPSTELTCPECGGVLAQIEEGSIVRFRCHTGHAYSKQTLLEATDDKIDDLLWRVLRAIDERTLVLMRRQSSAKVSADSKSIQDLQRQIRQNRARGAMIRELLNNQQGLGVAD
jgi:two-component system chemotaxis response regulator CheB